MKNTDLMVELLELRQLQGFLPFLTPTLRLQI